ncbi:MAG: hypothetical protein GY851_01525, partial [bacterium]|nr:hypothetical protein [bacterium]
MMTRRLTRQFLVALVLVTGLGAAAAATEFHVSPKGDDTNPGTEDKPFLSLEAARDAVRQAGTNGGATIWLHEGRYVRNATLTLEQQDSGTPDKPLVLRAVPGAEVILDGGVIISPTAFESVRKRTIRKRLVREVRDKVVQVDVKALGVTEYGAFGPRG